MARITVWDVNPNSPTYRQEVERFSIDVKEQEKLGLVSRAASLEEALAGVEPPEAEKPETPASLEKKSQPKSKPPGA